MTSTDLQRLTGEILDLRARVAELLDRVARYDSEISTANIEVARLEARVAEMEAENAKLHEALSRNDAYIARMKTTASVGTAEEVASGEGVPGTRSTNQAEAHRPRPDAGGAGATDGDDASVDREPGGRNPALDAALRSRHGEGAGLDARPAARPLTSPVSPVPTQEDLAKLGHRPSEALLNPGVRVRLIGVPDSLGTVDGWCGPSSVIVQWDAGHRNVIMAAALERCPNEVTPERVTAQDWATLAEMQRTAEDIGRRVESVRERFGLPRSETPEASPNGIAKEANTSGGEALEACALILEAQDPWDARLYPGIQYAAKVLRDLATRTGSEGA